MCLSFLLWTIWCVSTLQTHIETLVSRVYCFCWRCCHLWIARLAIHFATDKKQKWICFRLFFWSVGWFSFPFINLCTSLMVLCAVVSVHLHYSMLFFFLLLLVSTPHLPVQLWLCFQWFSALHCTSALLISIVDRLSFSQPFFFWFILYIFVFAL